MFWALSYTLSLQDHHIIWKHNPTSSATKKLKNQTFFPYITVLKQVKFDEFNHSSNFTGSTSLMSLDSNSMTITMLHFQEMHNLSHRVRNNCWLVPTSTHSPSQFILYHEARAIYLLISHPIFYWDKLTYNIV